MASFEDKGQTVEQLKASQSHIDDVGTTTTETRIHASRMEEVLLAEHPIRPLRKSFLKLYAVIFVGYLCSATNGFDANTFGGLSAIPSFVDFFGINTNNQGLIAALYVIGNVAGSFFAGPCADRYGRRVGMAIGSFICIIGAILQAAGQSLAALEAGRFVLGMGAVLVQTAGPSYVVEMAYPKYRGQLTGGFQACFFLGTIVSTWLEYGLNFINTDSSYKWRLPLAVQGLPSILILCFVYFIPETPRWLVAHDRLDEARTILIKYHGDGDPDSPVVALELQEMLEVIRLDGSDKRWWDFRELFNSRSARYRTFLVTCIAWFGQLDLPPTSYYFPLMAKTAGITSVQTQLLLNALQTPIMMVAALCGLRFIGKFGRRKLLMFSSAGMSASVAVITACTANQAGKPAVGATGVAFLYVFLVVFAFAWVRLPQTSLPVFGRHGLLTLHPTDSNAIPLPFRSPRIQHARQRSGVHELHGQRCECTQHVCAADRHCKFGMEVLHSLCSMGCLWGCGDLFHLCGDQGQIARGTR